ncbi:MAG: S8 family serine peptidase [Candidatus Aminicenantes bacterium]|nr:S8 family serine peptidase [Candidatus Aminicenantes bacterium]
MKAPFGRIIAVFGLVTGLTATAVMTPADGPDRPGQKAVPGPADLSGYAAPSKTAHPKIDARLSKAARLTAISGHESDTGGLIRVVLQTAERFPGPAGPGRPSVIPSRIASLGGRVELEEGFEIQALLPPAAVEFLAGDPLVSRLRLPVRPVEAAVQSEGVPRSGAQAWSDIPSFRAPEDPVKIAVLDLGFQGYQTRQGSELPSNVVVSSFRSDGDIAAGTSHGTACAEIIHDMAPEAKIYLVNFETDVELHAAVNYLMSEKVDIVSCALVWPGAGAGNGTGPICEDVKKCAEKGILWVGAAGDDAENHWEGTFSDPNGDLFHNFSGDDAILQWEVPAGASTRATLSWNDWGTWTGSSYGNPTQDYDLLLWRWTGTGWELLEYCDDWQDGTPGQTPVEQSSHWTSATAAVYGVSILKFGATINKTLEIFVQGASAGIEFPVPAGSLGIPADAVEALAVGATDAESDLLEAFSSRGPTSDGRIKPDLTAFSGVSTATYGPKAFAGTSASAPHVAGAAGLLMSKTPYTSAQVRTILESRALDLGPSGKDNSYGFGRLYLK